jgi:small subunit ribosomal protein S6
VVQQAIECISRTAVVYLGGRSGTTVASSPLLSYEDPIVLRIRTGHWHGFRFGERLRHDPLSGRLVIAGYFYAIRRIDDDGQLLAWHWDAARPPPPHVHAPVEDPRGRGRRLHIPTGGRVSLAQVLRFLIEEWDVVPARRDWSGGCARRMRRSRRWLSSRAPRPGGLSLPGPFSTLDQSFREGLLTADRGATLARGDAPPQTRIAEALVNEYELTYILHPRLTADEANAAAERVSALITGQGGEVLSTDNWGRRRLAYPINHNFEGTYVYTSLRMPAEGTRVLEQQLRISEEVIRHLLIRGIIPYEGPPPGEAARGARPMRAETREPERGYEREREPAAAEIAEEVGAEEATSEEAGAERETARAEAE